MVRKYSGPFPVRDDGAKDRAACVLGGVMVLTAEGQKGSTGLGRKVLSYIMSSEVHAAN